MNALTYRDYLGIALFTIVLYIGAKIVWLIIESKIDNLRKKRHAQRPINTYNLLESSHKIRVTTMKVADALRKDIKQGLIADYMMAADFVVYRQKDGSKEIIDLSRYNVIDVKKYGARW